MIRRRMFRIGFAFSLVSGLLAVGWFGLDRLSPQAAPGIGQVVSFPVALDLSDATGEAVNATDMAGRFSLVTFGFTNCPDICPTSLAVMAQAERQLVARGSLQTPFRGVLISVDPERDQGSRLTEYVTAFSPSFTGVTGQRERVIQFAQQVHVARPMKVRLPGGDYTVDHPGQIVIVNPAAQDDG